MLLIYTPEGEERQEFVFHPDKLMSPEAEALEDIGGQSWDSYTEFGAKFMSGNFRARRALLWIFLRRENPKLRFSDLVVRVDELDFDFEAEERQKIRENVERADDMPEAQRAEILEALEDSANAATLSALAADLDEIPTEPDGDEGKGEGDAEGTNST